MLPADSKLACICPHLKISLHGGINALVDHTLPQVLLQPCTPAAAHLPLPVTPTSRLISRREPSLTGGAEPACRRHLGRVRPVRDDSEARLAHILKSLKA
jgi:hypothetical protein